MEAMLETSRGHESPNSTITRMRIIHQFKSSIFRSQDIMRGFLFSYPKSFPHDNAADEPRITQAPIIRKLSVHVSSAKLHPSLLFPPPPAPFLFLEF